MTDYAHDLSEHRFDKAKDALRQAELLRIAHSAFDTRQIHDYQDFQVLTYEQAKMQFEDAMLFIETVGQKRVLLIDGKLSLPTIS